MQPATEPQTTTEEPTGPPRIIYIGRSKEELYFRYREPETGKLTKELLPIFPIDQLNRAIDIFGLNDDPTNPVERLEPSDFKNEFKNVKWYKIPDEAYNQAAARNAAAQAASASASASASSSSKKRKA